MKGINAISLGDRLIRTVNNSSKTKTVNNQIKHLQLNTEEVLKLASKDKKLPWNSKDHTFGMYLYGWNKMILDLTYKAKSKYEILVMSLKENGKEVLKGAYSKSKVKGGEEKKFHITKSDIELQTGHTNKKGKIVKSTTTDVFPEKYNDYIWRLNDKNLLIVSDYYGLFGKKKPIEEIAGEWKIKSKRATFLKDKAMLITRDSIDRGLPAVKETEINKYTMKDYVHAVRHLQNNKVYDYMRGYRSTFSKDPVIDDKFLKEVAEVRRCQNIIAEWNMTRTKNEINFKNPE